jgi:hypothetical protein
MNQVIAADAVPVGARQRVAQPNRGGARDRWVRRLPLLPALLFAIVVTQVPFLVTLYLSTLGWNALRPASATSSASATTPLSSPTPGCAPHWSTPSC